ncbi:hypothetical protein [Shewanella baltica]|uniref:hypothetical protein n=1 Tax=Shewanella baltica TaxID=62322 RepID=UPI003D7A0B44
MQIKYLLNASPDSPVAVFGFGFGLGIGIDIDIDIDSLMMAHKVNLTSFVLIAFISNTRLLHL